MSIIHNEPLPRFFLVHHYMDDDGNLNTMTAVAAGHMVSCYVGRHEKSPMIYAWARSDAAPIAEWVWTDEPMFNPSTMQYESIKPATVDRLKSMGYQPVMYMSPDNIDFEYQVYAKIQRGATLDRAPKYLEYLPDGETCLGFNDHPKVMTVWGVYDIMAEEDGKKNDYRIEYIFGLDHLHAILHKHIDSNPLANDVVLIITRHDTTGKTRFAVIEAALEMGYNTDELKKLIDLMASGHVVFDNELRGYSLKKVLVPNLGYRTPSNQFLLTTNEFYEVYAYGLEPQCCLKDAEVLHRSCLYALDWAQHYRQGALDSIPTEHLSFVPRR